MTCRAAEQVAAGLLPQARILASPTPYPLVKEAQTGAVGRLAAVGSKTDLDWACRLDWVTRAVDEDDRDDHRVHCSGIGNLFNGNCDDRHFFAPVLFFRSLNDHDCHWLAIVIRDGDWLSRNGRREAARGG